MVLIISNDGWERGNPSSHLHIISVMKGDQMVRMLQQATPVLRRELQARPIRRSPFEQHPAQAKQHPTPGSITPALLLHHIIQPAPHTAPLAALHVQIHVRLHQGVDHLRSVRIR